MPSLDGPLTKLDRARQHLREFDRAADEFVTSEPRPYRGISETDSRDGGRVWRLKIERHPPDRLGLLVGDIIHNMRASLDHLVWQLALLTTPTPNARTEFPIYLDAQPASSGRSAFKREGQAKIRDIPQTAQSVIESKQPYHASDPEHTPIWLLHTLDIEDKHKLIPTLGVLATGALGFPEGVLTDHQTDSRGGSAFEDGDMLLRVGAESARRIDAYGEPRFTFGVALSVEGPARGYSAWEILNDIQSWNSRRRVRLLRLFLRS